MYTFENLQNEVNKALEAEIFVKEPKDLYEPVYYALESGGKRLRPVLALMAFNLFNEDINQIVKPVLGLEIFHNFTLIHDDIMDKADVRRKKPTVHKKWNDNVAILSGDAMFIKAYEYLFQYQGEHFREAIQTFNQTALEVCEGQQYDMNFETQEDVTEEEYLKMIKLKTAVLIAASLKIGALMGSASDEDVQSLYNFGLYMGMAFQLQDDFLDTFGNSDVFGKKIGGDIATNKKTYLYIKALKTSDETDSQRLKELFRSDYSGKTEEKVRQVTDIFKKNNVDQITKSKIEEYFGRAYEALKSVSVRKEKKQKLLELADRLVKRKM
jgi:geranylgeranyl diphosphate synthase type II